MNQRIPIFIKINVLYTTQIYTIYHGKARGQLSVCPARQTPSPSKTPRAITPREIPAIAAVPNHSEGNRIHLQHRLAALNQCIPIFVKINVLYTTQIYTIYHGKARGQLSVCPARQTPSPSKPAYKDALLAQTDGSTGPARQAHSFYTVMTWMSANNPSLNKYRSHH